MISATKIILQSPTTAETMAVRTATMLDDDFRGLVLASTLEGLETMDPALRRGAMPVGSVEFVTAYMRLEGMRLPDPLSYPPGCEPFLARDIQTQTVRSVLLSKRAVFVKPVQTKLFNGFVYSASASPALCTEHDREQIEALLRLDGDIPVYVSDVMDLWSEWRYYVQGGRVIGRSRYDAGADDAPEPDEDTVMACIDAMGIQHPFALDMGVTCEGSTVLIEVNDAWAIGLYRGAMKPQAYLGFLCARWDSLKAPHPIRRPGPA